MMMKQRLIPGNSLGWEHKKHPRHGLARIKAHGLDRQDVALGLVADFGFEGESFGDEVAEGVGGVGAVFVGFVEFRGDSAGGIEGPRYFFEIVDEFFAIGIDEEADVAGLIAKAAVDGVDAVADGRVGSG